VLEYAPALLANAKRSGALPREGLSLLRRLYAEVRGLLSASSPAAAEDSDGGRGLAGASGHVHVCNINAVAVAAADAAADQVGALRFGVRCVCRGESLAAPGLVKG
jgi:hypothetical protein